MEAECPVVFFSGKAKEVAMANSDSIDSKKTKARTEDNSSDQRLPLVPIHVVFLVIYIGAAVALGFTVGVLSIFGKFNFWWLWLGVVVALAILLGFIAFRDGFVPKLQFIHLMLAAIFFAIPMGYFELIYSATDSSGEVITGPYAYFYTHIGDASITDSWLNVAVYLCLPPLGLAIGTALYHWLMTEPTRIILAVWSCISFAVSSWYFVVLAGASDTISCTMCIK